MAAIEEPRHTSAKDFVGASVKVIPVTEGIIAAIMPFFPKSAKVISGHLSEEQLYWKINYHWEYLIEAISHCSALAIDQKYKDALGAIRKLLESNVPDPRAGYRKSKEPGLPKDKSSHTMILARHALVSQSKRDFKTVVEAAGILKKTTRDPKDLMLAYAPVAKPAQGKHSTGYALDISGNNDVNARIARSLGATVVFNEGSHVHCEWKNGVDVSAKGGSDSVGAAQRGTRLEIDNKINAVRHCMLRMA